MTGALLFAAWILACAAGTWFVLDAHRGTGRRRFELTRWEVARLRKREDKYWREFFAWRERRLL